MKSKSNITSHLRQSLIACIFLTTGFALTAQDNQNAAPQDFKILIEKTPQGFQLKSLAGSAWIDLSFIINQDKPQAIDEYGMTELSAVSESKNPDFYNYLFTITKRKNKIELKGIEGTAWKKLTFQLPENGKQMIDRSGMTDQ